MLNPFSRVLGDFKTTGKGELRFNCPFCQARVGKTDTKHRLYINPSLHIHGVVGWYHCMRCKARGPVKRLLAGCGFEDQRYSASKWAEFVKQLKGFGSFAPRQTIQVELPNDYMEVIEGTRAHRYLIDRGLDNKVIEHYRIGYGTEDLSGMSKEERKHFAGEGRVIVPDFDDEGNCIYWVARTYRKHRLRYKNPDQSHSSGQVFHLAAAMAYTEVVITEGVFSAMAVGDDAIGTYGKNVTNIQIAMLVRAGFDKYIVALDGDARKDAVVLAQALHERRCSVKMVEFEHDEDPDSCQDFAQRRKDALPYNLRNRVAFTLRGQGQRNATQNRCSRSWYGKNSYRADR
jgi:DNA primase